MLELFSFTLPIKGLGMPSGFHPPPPHQTSGNLGFAVQFHVNEKMSDWEWRVIENVYLRSHNQGFWTCLGDTTSDIGSTLLLNTTSGSDFVIGLQ